MMVTTDITRNSPQIHEDDVQSEDKGSSISQKLFFLVLFLGKKKNVFLLCLCLLVALVVRIWLVIQTRGFMDADEALLGIQAQHIVQGERPIYYYGQPYMGSLEAYLVALVFACIGSSPWTLRIIPILLSLVVIWLTWLLAGALADYAKVSSSTKNRFTTVALLLATVPPLYDTVMELRTWGGHVEIYIIMLLLLYATSRLTQRWDRASGREIAKRWAMIGLLIGLGLWIYPLIASAILAMLIWISVFLLQRLGLWNIFQRKKSHQLEQARFRRLEIRNIFLAVMSLPTMLLGFAPGIYWGMQHQWANVLYLFAPGSDGGNSADFVHHYGRLPILGGTVQLYVHCLVPEVIGGSLPSEPITSSSPISFFLLTAMGVTSMIAVALLLAGSQMKRFRDHHALITIRNLVALPMLFAASTISLFCFSSVVGNSIFQPCTHDGVGRYAAPILLALPFIGATLFVALAKIRKRFILSLVLLIIYLGATINTYVQSDPYYVFQSFNCLYAPTDNEPIIDYMEQQHIYYAWGTIALGNALIFESHNTIIVADHDSLNIGAVNRLPKNLISVVHANRASLLALVPRTDRYPVVLKKLDKEGIKYRLARFPTEPGNMDVLVITPLNRTLLPKEASTPGSC